MPPTLPNFASQLKPELRHIPLTPLQIHELLLALPRPNYSIINIAADFDLTLPQLSLLISKGEFADEFRACTDANTRFIRHAAAIQLHTVIRTLVATLEEVHYQLHSVPIDHLNHKSLEARRFMMEVGRRSAVTLQQLTKLNVPTRITEAPTTITKARPAQPASAEPNSTPHSEPVRLSTGSMSMRSEFDFADDFDLNDAPDIARESHSGTNRQSRAAADRESDDNWHPAPDPDRKHARTPDHATNDGANEDTNHTTPQPNLARATSTTQIIDATAHSKSSAFEVAAKAGQTPATAIALAKTNPHANATPSRHTPRSLRAAAQAKPAATSSNPASTPAPHTANILDPAFQKQLTEALSLADAFLADLPPEAHPPHS